MRAITNPLVISAIVIMEPVFFVRMAFAQSYDSIDLPINATLIDLTDTSISTTGDRVAGLLARQNAGAGGNAVDHDNRNGGDGGSASSLSITLTQGSSADGNSITTTGEHSEGILAQASGGAGTTGGDDGIGISVNVFLGNGLQRRQFRSRRRRDRGVDHEHRRTHHQHNSGHNRDEA